jgi:hypothetical protein
MSLQFMVVSLCIYVWALLFINADAEGLFDVILNGTFFFFQGAYEMS